MRIARELPDIIKEVGFPFYWEESDVWTLDVPVMEIPITELDWHFDIPFWNNENGFYDLKPLTVIENPAQYPHHQKRIEQSDLSHPLDIFLNPKTDYWTLLDGLHRLVRLAELKRDIVQVRKIPLDLLATTKGYRERE